jgi:hypothetical protein
MPQLGQGPTGALKSTPKLTKINGDDHDKVIFRNMGNNHAYPFIWATTATVVSGTSSVVVASGIKWHGLIWLHLCICSSHPEGKCGLLLYHS